MIQPRQIPGRITTSGLSPPEAIEQARREINALAGGIFARARLLERQSGTGHPNDLELTANVIFKSSHRLGRPLTGWVVVDLRVSAVQIKRVTVDASGHEANDDTDIWLLATSNVTARVLVF